MSDDVSSQKIEAESADLRRRVLLISSILAVVYGIWFAVDNYKTSFSLALADSVVAVIFSFIGYFSYRRSNSMWPRYAAIATCCVFFFSVYLSGGAEGTGAAWSFVVPLIVFFLGGFRVGLSCSLIYMTLCALAVIYNFASPGLFYIYPVEVLKRFFGIFAFSTIIAAGYEYHKFKAEQRLLELLNTAHIAVEKTSISELKYRTLFDGSGHGIIVADVEREEIVEVNPAASMMFGYQNDELKGESIELLHPADELFDTMHLFRKNAESVFAQVTQLPCRRKDGSIFYADLHTACMTLEGRKRVVGFFSDVTRRVQAERELVAARSRADAASEAKSVFLANMSHEIRTPIHGIYGMVELLLQTQMTDEQKQYAEIIRDSSNSLLVLISDILDITKIESGKMAVESVEFDLISLVREVFEQMRPKATLKGLISNLYLHENLPEFVRGDALKLRQILVNLIDNAIKFTVHGEILVNVSPDPNSAEKQQILFEVNDSGIGIPDEKVGLLFQSFTQVDSSSTRRYGGAGLGLSISRKLANLMGGDISVKSELGRGSHFWFSLLLPYVKRKSHERPQNSICSKSGRLLAVSVDGVGQHQYNALFAEDNPVNQFVVKAMLNKMGMQVDVVANGHEAILALASRKYDILLLDLQMPLLDGFETIRLVRGNVNANFDRSIPVVAVTADAFPETRETCLKAGMNDCLIKPFKMHDLDQIVKKWLTVKH
ncbi:MAG: hypothetical protein A2W80_15770 [Candidatus Riflebacteria bacterium GWC2_50_8]|nr:MAG: hypothetical protein A2W80_15770 [Candidatus Riflebacteria bacterium GWC2_50_8]